MGLFNYNNPVIVFMVKVANMIIVSLYWILCCIPVVTVLPACAALYHTVNKVIFGNGNGVTRDFFRAFKDALKPGVALSVIMELVGGLVVFGIYTGLQIWDADMFGTVYMAAGVLIGFIFLTTVLYAAPTLSRFEGGISVVLRLSMYFAMKNQFRSAWFTVLLGLAFWSVDFFPLLLLVMPALYTDLIRGGMEKVMKDYIKDAGLEDAETPEQNDTTETIEDVSPMEMDKLLGGK